MGPWATANYCRAGIKSLRGTGGECKSQEIYIGKREKYETQFKGPYVERKMVIAAVCISAHYRVQYNNFENLMNPTCRRVQNFILGHIFQVDYRFSAVWYTYLALKFAKPKNKPKNQYACQKTQILMIVFQYRRNFSFKI